MASLFCRSFNLVELYNLIVGGNLKIIWFSITKQHFWDSSILHEKALTQYAWSFFPPCVFRANMGSK